MDLILTGKVIAPNSPLGLANARVEAWETASDPARRIAAAPVLRGGAFTLVIAENLAKILKEKDIPVDLRVVARGTPVRVDPPVAWRVGDATEGLALRVGLDSQGHDMQGARAVFGQVTHGTARPRPAAGLRVRVFDRDMRSETLLGETLTAQDGRYSVTYTRESFAAAEKDYADLVVRVFDAEGKVALNHPGPDQILFNAGPEARIDIRLDTAPAEATSLFERLLDTLKPLIRDVPLTELSENGARDDITFLSRETRTPGIQIEHLVMAHRLAEETGTDPAVLFALLRMDTFLGRETPSLRPSRPEIRLDDDLRGILLDAALVPGDQITRDVKAAAEARIVPKAAVRKVKKLRDVLEGLRDTAETRKDTGEPTLIAREIGRLAAPDRLGRLAGLLRDGTDIETVIAELTRPGDPSGAGETGDDPVTEVITEGLLGGGASLEKVARAADLDPSRLAGLDDSALRQALRKADPQASDKALTQRARKLAREAEALHPTEALRGRLASGRRLGRDPQRTAALFERFPDLRIETTRLDHFFADKKLTRPADREMLADLKKVQRVMRIAPDLDRAEGLLQQKLGSAADVVRSGKARFVDEIGPKAGLSRAEAEATFARAEVSHSAALMISGDIQAMLGSAPAVSTSATLKLKSATLADDFPNLKSLFKGVDTCACPHCRSVLSPAAYLVEIIEYLGQRDMVDLTQTPPARVNKAHEVLFARRGEILDLDLDCANAETPLPYIDLACEILEHAIAPLPGVVFNGALAAGTVIPAPLLSLVQAQGWAVTDKAILQEAGSAGDLILRDSALTAKLTNTGGNTWSITRLRQTHGTAQERAAAPEYVNAQAYASLAAESYAFALPFDLNHCEASAYFDRFGVRRASLMRDFETGGAPGAAAIAAEELGLTEAARTVIVTDGSAAQDGVWGLPAVSVVADMAVVSTLLDKTGLSYDALDRLLQMSFIDPADAMFIEHLDLSCDLDQKRVAGLSAAALDRIHRFLRLQKATGWRDVVLNSVLTQARLGNGTLDNQALVHVADIQRLARRTGLTPEVLTGCFGDFDRTQLTGTDERPLYQRLFQNAGTLGHVEPLLGVDQVGAGGTLSAAAAALAAILRLARTDFDRLVAALTDDQLTYANLSTLTAAARLIEARKLTARDYLTLLRRSGRVPTAAPAEMLAFLDDLDHARSGPVALADMPFLLEHGGEDAAQREIRDETITALLEGLQGAYQDAFAEARSPYDDGLSAAELRAPIKDRLLRLPEMGEEDANTVLRIYDADWTSPPDPDAAATLTGLLGGALDVAGIVPAAAAILAAATPATRETAQKAFADTLLAAIAAHLHGRAKATALRDAIADFSRADGDTVEIVLAAARLRQPGPAQPLVSALLTDDALIDTAGDPAAPPAITAAAFADQYAAIRLLQKVFAVLSATDLAPDDLAWVMAHAADLGWMQIDSLPWQGGQAAVPHLHWDRLSRALALFAAYPPMPDPANPAVPITLRATLDALLPGAGTTRDAWLDALARLTGRDRATLADLDAHFGWSTPNLSQWHLPETWEALARCLAHLRALNATVAEAASCAQPVLTATQTASLRTGLKARYAETTWLTTLGEIMDAIRPKKRDALVAYLLATRPEFTTANDLYDHFLIDTQMEARMPSSRIVQAHGTIQLFVERSRMGLEPQAAADTGDTGWEQWVWMRNYRVWEANRKVFVYPENWIEPELLDDKSFLFEALEDTLLQNEVTEITAEDALARYLEGLDGISFLEVVACCYQSETYTMHVFARTKGGDPAQYYYRTFEKERYWSPWSLVEVDITSNTLLAFVRRGRLNLAWPVISEESKPDQDVVTPGVSESPSSGTMQNPAMRLRIQLAVSEYANGDWKPRKISQDAIVTPETYTTDPSRLDREQYNLIYSQFDDQIWLFHTDIDGAEYHTRDGIFDVAGCKGYPELLKTAQESLRDFYPDYLDTELAAQRYVELGRDGADSLAIRNMITFWGFATRLRTTPGTFRVTHPHVITLIDLLYLFLQALLYSAHSTSSVAAARYIKLPLGTWLPYFFEDSERAYAVVPGLYSPDDGGKTKRTFSDILKLVEDILALVARYVARLTATPAPDPAAVLSDLLEDPDFIDIRDEIQRYFGLRFAERFENLYHPLVCPLRATLYKSGIDKMMARDSQLQITAFDFDDTFDPTSLVAQPYPVEDVDFSSSGSYAAYNWELFFHTPLMIAKRLASENRFDEAMEWYHRIFNPTGTLDGDAPQKYWVTKPFFQATSGDYLAQRIDRLLTDVADPASPERHELEVAIAEWRRKPFRPHVVARFRPVAYQRATVMSYIGTLIDWGDYLFRQDTMESITQATQLYILADKLLGPKPRTVKPPVAVTAQTYTQLKADLDAFGNALVELETYLPDLGILPEGGDELPAPPVTLSSLYFCIPPNENMLKYYDTVEDRLFKIRNSQNIDGVERVLALFAPPIDPGMLVRAAAAGLSLSSILAGMNGPLPAYRFQVMANKATELTQEVRALGNALLAALEKKDAEALALLRNDLEVQLLKAQRSLQELEIEAAEEQITVLEKTRAITEERNAFYTAFERINANEQLNLDKLAEAQDFEMAAGIVRATGAVLGIIPDISFGGHGAGGSPAVHATFGGSTLATVAEAAATVLSIFSGIASYEATRAGTLGRLDRTKDDADLQARQTSLELAHIDQQIVAAGLRRDIAVKALEVHDVQTDHAEQIGTFLEDKYTSRELYQWMANDITKVYYRAYQLAYDTARKAERCYQHELGSSETFLEFGYWDSRRKGLQTANKLLHDIKRMETRYLEANRREYEITKHVSLRQLDPLALTRLKTSGTCDFEIPEALYDMDHPGHYFRRVKSVAISIPCVAGPFASVSARLSQVNNRYRKSTAKAAGAMTPQAEYEEAPGNDTRFAYDIGATQSVATSSGQNDTGLFELSFRDDRYLPFEGTGAIGDWRLEFPDTVRQFDYSTISDVIVHVRYTARDGGSSLRSLAQSTLKAKLQDIAQGLAKTGMHVMVDLKRDDYNAWHALKSTGTTTLTLTRDRLPYALQPLTPVLGTTTLLAKVAGAPASFTVGVGGTDVSLNFSPEWQLNHNDHPGLALDVPVTLTVAAGDLAALEELSLVIGVSVS
ncbi:neuraminidase-like domain-containing protein [Maliponia aquimaris]|uniref:Virulence plasmid A protein n=1 Tax=Maliponia aquimaris TaxID=1673631 RepID=A0A238K2X7_9RHOB|nr:neuraminidase-like domain-containing protein [Maliponia aquimaris]SMX36817.1 hypothetical protein MAA8898_01059 [Maliponia aquimaris]